MSEELNEELNEELKAVLESHLPAQQVAWLQEALSQRDDLKSKVATLQADRDEWRVRAEQTEKFANDLKSRVKSQESLDAAWAEHTDAARKLEVMTAVMGVKHEMTEGRLEDMRNLTETVFQNNRFKYEKTGPVVTEVGGYADNGVAVPQGTIVEHHVTKVEGEGTPPEGF